MADQVWLDAVAGGKELWEKTRGVFAEENPDLSYTDLFDTDFSGFSLVKANFKGTDLSGSNFTGADLTGALFNDCDLVGAKFAGAIMEGASFEGAELANADFGGADAPDTTVIPPSVRRARMIEARRQAEADAAAQKKEG